MSKSILIVESDALLAEKMRGHLQGKGFSVEETQDAKRSLELIRQTKPSLVLMGVELGSGQNGYILCGKLKKDDELKTIPLVIVGSPDGFAQHKKLKTRADDYVDAKKGDLDGLALLDRVGGLIGFPEVVKDSEAEGLTQLDSADDDGISFSDIMEDSSADAAAAPPPQEFALEETTAGEDAELDMLDDAFEASTDAPVESADPASSVEPGSIEDPIKDFEEERVEAAADDVAAADLSDVSEVSEVAVDELSADGLEDLAGDERTVISDRNAIAATPTLSERIPPPERPAMRPPPVLTAPPVSPPSLPSVQSAADAAELRSLRAKVTELDSALADERSRAEEAEGRLAVAQSQLSGKEVELETAKKTSATGKSDKEFFALREAAQKKDKDIVRIKSELNQKESEVLELRDREMQLEQKVSEVQEELAQKDARIKTLTAQTEQQTADKRKVDAALATAKEEGRTSGTRIAGLEVDLEAASRRGDGLAEQVHALQSDLTASRTENLEAQAELERLRAEVAELSSRCSTQTDELAAERQRISELETQAQKNEERLSRFYAKLKTDEQVREKLRKALNLALQLVGEGAASDLEVDVEEPVDA